jgi:hypothetical protein
LGEKYEKSEKKKKTRKMAKNLINQDYFFPYLRRGHQFDHVSRGVQERIVEDSIKSPHFFTNTLPGNV